MVLTGAVPVKVKSSAIEKLVAFQASEVLNGPLSTTRDFFCAFAPGADAAAIKAKVNTATARGVPAGVWNLYRTKKGIVYLFSENPCIDWAALQGGFGLSEPHYPSVPIRNAGKQCRLTIRSVKTPEIHDRNPCGGCVPSK
jgi:hypothetical protein